MRSTFVVAIALFACLCASPGAAQTGDAAVDDPEATLVSELIVIAPTRGPAWWRVSKGESVVWILGMPAGPVPKDLAWDRTAVERRLKGAEALLLPPRVWVSFVGTKDEPLRLVSLLPGVRQFNGDVEKEMPPLLAERFSRVRTGLNKPTGHYATPVPLLAALRLQGDFMDAAGLDRTGGWALIEAAAKRHRVKAVRPERVKAGTVTTAQAALTRPEAAACFDALLDSAEVPAERYRAAADGWARGDLQTAISAPREAFGICENRLFEQGSMRRSIDIQVKAIEAALAKPGKTVALSHLRTLLAPEGVLQRLAADGYEIVDPTGMPAED